VGRVTANARWAFLGLAVKVLAQGVGTFLVARLVGPHVLGIMSVGLVYATLTLLLLDQGMGQALIRAPQLRITDVATVQVATTSLAIATMLLTWAIAIPVAVVTGSELAIVLAVLASGLVFKSVVVPGQAVLQRDFQFRWLAGCDSVSSVVGVSASVLTAAMHGGAIAVAVQVLVTDGVYAIGVLRKSGAPVRGANMAALREMLGFTSQIAGSQWLGFLSRNVDNMLIYQVLGSTPLGYYSLSYRFMMLPITNLTMVANRVLLPTYSRLQDDIERFRQSFLRSTKLMSLTANPMMALLIVFASPLIIGLEGPEWRQAVVPTQVLALVAIIQAQTSLITPAIVAFGRSAWQLKWMLVSTALTVVMFGVTVFWGLNAVCIGYFVLNAVTLPVPIALVGKLGGFRWGDFVRSVRPGLALGALTLAVGFGVRAALEPLGTPLLVVAVGGGLITVLLVAPLVRVLMPRATLDLLSLASRGSKRTASPVDTGAPTAVAS
jgi:O-antigen/teichoic acid export membrane protein